jgi:hypothetical protein
MSSPEGTTRIGAGVVQLPSWLPAYPGAKSTGSISASSGEGNTGTETFESGESAERIVSFYESSLKNEGLIVEKTSFSSDKESTTLLSAKSSDEQRSGLVTVTRKEGKTIISLSFQLK